MKLPFLTSSQESVKGIQKAIMYNDSRTMQASVTETV
jgi:hypothetical protein